MTPEVNQQLTVLRVALDEALSTTPAQVLADLKKAGFQAAVLKRRQERNGVEVKKSGGWVSVQYMDWERKGDQSSQFHAVVQALEAAGYELKFGPYGESGGIVMVHKP